MKKSSDEYQAGIVAKEWFEDQILHETRRIESQKAGKYSRWLATTYKDNTEINTKMIQLGLSTAY